MKSYNLLKIILLAGALTAGIGSVPAAGQVTATPQDNEIFAEIDRMMGRYDYIGALAAMDSLITVDVQDSVAVAAMPEQERMVQKGLQSRRAQCLRKMYRYDEAVEALGAVVALDRRANPVPVMAEIADCRIQQGDLTEALNLYGIITMIDPVNLYFRVQQTMLYYYCGLYEDCIANAEMVMAVDSIPAIVSLAGDSWNMLGQPDSALVCYREALQLNPYNEKVIDKASSILLRRKEYGEIMYMTDRFLKRDTSLNVLGIRGMTFYLQKAYPESLRLFERMRALGDSTYSTNFYLGLNYLETDPVKALYAFEDAYRADTTNIEGVYYYAYTLGRVTIRDSLTQSMFDKGIELLQPDPDAMYRFYSAYGDWLVKKERFDEARDKYIAARSYDPERLTVLPSLGYCYERLKDWKNAAKYYKEFMDRAENKESDVYNFTKEALDYVNGKLFMEEK